MLISSQQRLRNHNIRLDVESPRSPSPTNGVTVCNRVKLLVNDSAIAVDVVFLDSVAVIHIPKSIDALTLRKHIEHIVDNEQSECATRLWSEDSFARFFEITTTGLEISCIPQS